MLVHLSGGGTRTFDGGPATASEVLLSFGVNPAGVIVIRDGRLIPDDAPLGSNDEIRVIRVSHGG